MPVKKFPPEKTLRKIRGENERLALDSAKAIVAKAVQPIEEMTEDPFENHLEQAKDRLRADCGVGDLCDFERGVWAEIALHDERWAARVARFFWERDTLVSVPAVAGSVMAAVLLGVLAAMVQANAYGDSRSEAMEQRYVAAIHPVLRSESESHTHPESL